MKKRVKGLSAIALLLVMLISMFSLTGCLGLVSCTACMAFLEDGEYEIESEAPKSQATVSNERYCYSTLDEQGKQIYDELYNCVINFDESVEVSTNDTELLDKVSNCINADYGELFWFNGYNIYTTSLFGVANSVEVEPIYTMTESERDNYQVQIDQVVDSWLSQVPTDAGDYEKSKWVYETLISNVDYDENSPDNQNIISVFLNGKTVCQGYSCAANYLFSKMGIQSIIVPGTANGGPHAWNCVRLDGEYYMMDVTWGNSCYGGDCTDKDIYYNTLNITTADMNVDHTPDVTPYPIPECYSINDNYFYQEGCYFDSFQRDKIGKVFHNASVRDSTVAIKLSNSELYEQVKTYFIDDSNFTNYSAGRTCINYILDPDHNIITFEYC